MAGEFVQNLLGRIFPKAGRPESKIPFLSGRLVRENSYREAYAKWMDSPELNHDMTVLQNAFENADNQTLGFNIYRSAQSNGFYFNRNLAIDLIYFPFLFDYFSERVLALGYTIYTSDFKIEEKPAGMQKLEKHYLKPPVDLSDLPIDQAYGNILIELYYLDDVPLYLKLMANVYSDRNYREPKKFLQLMDILFLNQP